MSEQIDTLIRRYEALKAGRSQWHAHLDDLARVMLPRRLGFVTETTAGDRRTELIFDGTPMQAARGLANAVGGMLRPEGQRWFSLRAEDDAVDNTDEAKEWLTESKDAVNDALDNPRARFRQATGEVDMDLVVFGSAVMFIGEGRRLNSLLFQSVHLKDAVVFWNEAGEPEGLFQSKRLTLRQARDRFGDALSEATREKIAKGDLDDRIQFLHAVLPRAEGRPDALLARDLPFADIWIEYDERKLLESSGFHEFPFVVPRWDTSSGEDYGRSPGMIALPDAFTLQAMGETMLVAGQRAADPPLMVPNDGSFTEANTFPGGLIHYDVDTAVQVRGNPFFPLESGGNLPLTRDMQLDVRQSIFAAFFRNVLNLPVNGPEMTATEVIQRKEEFIREIGPVFGRLETDYTAPMVERAFNIMLRANALPPIPEALQGRNVRFEYESPVKRVRQQIEAAAAREWVREHIEAAQATGQPDILDVVNFDAYSRFSAEAVGIPHEIVNGRERVAAIRQARQQALQQAQEAAEIQSTVETMDVAASAAKKAGLTEAA